MSQAPYRSPVEVLLVEDDPHDVELTLHALHGAKLRNHVHVVRDGAEALDFLQQHTPDLILLDVNLPKVDGRDLLKQIRGDERLRHIPVIVVTSSAAEEDFADASVMKPIAPAVFLKAVNAIGQFWLEIVRLG